MAINYFENLGFGQSLRDSGNALAEGIQRRTERQRLEEAQKKQEQANQLKFESEQQKQLAAQAAGMFYNSLQSGDKEGAKQIAAKYQNEINSLGDPSFTVDRVNMMLETPEGLEQLKQASLGIVQMAGGPEQFAKFAESQQIKPMTAYEQAQAKAKQQDLAFKGQEVGMKEQELQLAKQRLDLDRETKKLEAMQKSEAKTANELKRQELQMKIEEQKAKVEQAKLDKQIEFESGAANIDNALRTLQDIRSTPEDTIRAAVGPVDSAIFTLQPDVADFEEKVKKFESQAFLSQVPQLKGMGALSQAEGEKLAAALENMSLRQSPQAIMQNVAEAEAILLGAKERLARRLNAQQPQQQREAQQQVIEIGGYKVREIR